MDSPRSRSHPFILIGIAALLLVAVATLIAGIHSFEFRDARPLEYRYGPVGGSEGTEATGLNAVMILLRILVTIAAAVVLFQMIFNRRFRIYYLVLIAIFVGILLAAEFVGCNRMPPVEFADRSTEELMEQPPVEAASEDPPVVPEPSRGLYLLVAIALAGGTVIAAVLLVLRWVRGRRQQEPDGLGEVLESLTTAARRLRAGEDAYTVVLFCYQEMLRILSVVARIDATYMTPREFAMQLQRVGLSGDHVIQLTGMFEIVRYARRVDSGFAERALRCLEAIREAHHDAQT